MAIAIILLSSSSYRCIPSPLRVQTYLSALRQMGVVQRAVLGNNNIIVSLLSLTAECCYLFFIFCILYFFRPSPRLPSRPALRSLPSARYDARVKLDHPPLLATHPYARGPTVAVVVVVA